MKVHVVTFPSHSICPSSLSRFRRHRSNNWSSESHLLFSCNNDIAEKVYNVCIPSSFSAEIAMSSYDKANRVEFIYTHFKNTYTAHARIFFCTLLLST